MSRLLPVVAALAAATFLLMGWYSRSVLVPAAGGQLPLDARFAGYDGAAVLDYLRALDDGGRGVYLLEMRWLDAVFMASFALSLGLGLQGLARGRGRMLRALLMLPPLAYLSADWAENAVVRELLLRGPEGFLPELAGWASRFTQAKFALVLLCGLCLGALWRSRPREA